MIQITKKRQELRECEVYAIYMQHAAFMLQESHPLEKYSSSKVVIY